jgi:hypothetical protein
MGPRTAYKDMLDNVVSPITCVSMNHQNQLEQMVNGAMFATASDHPWTSVVKCPKYTLFFYGTQPPIFSLDVAPSFAMHWRVVGPSI